MKKNKSLLKYNTFGIDVDAKYFASFTSFDELKRLAVTKEFLNENLLVLGGGSNLLLTKNVDALVLKNDILGIQVLKENKSTIDISVGAGENWHEFVMFCVNNNYGGLENLSLIPGNVGAAPMQNIGAYGSEIKDTFLYLEAFNIGKLQLEKFNNKDCQFGYRESIFKKELKNKFIILNVVFRLNKTPHQLNTNYGDILKEIELFNIKNPTIKDVSNAVIRIRARKLPDPKKIGNSGSFFKNPIISKNEFLKLEVKYPEIAHYVISENQVKIAAGWLIEKAGWKGKTINNFGVHKNQALVLVNYGGADGSEIHKLSNEIIADINLKFNIQLEKEVNII
ncbi:MAG: UDP-N-acetylmuramate dehydrogenase [Flavobacteriales bacterium]|jgi:UDP-N-acetylmuramate dehydrogenase|nr:UDP-N-acetylmuramate dehydrogenase [Flavobacteriales bacterium]